MFKNGMPVTEAATGDGPVNAAFKAIERSVGFEVQLQDYSLRGVTEGTDALGEATVRVMKDEKIYVGRGVSTDVIEASVKAYINAINRVINDNGKGASDRRETI
jgi:2-isopropylmalate synthase